MTAYWLLFLFFAIGAFLARQQQALRGLAVPAGSAAGLKAEAAHRQRTSNERSLSRPMLLVGALLLILVVGLRHEVGADWETYDYLYRRSGMLSRALERGDPAYFFLNFVGRRLGTEIWLVNLVCAAIFAWGLFRFLRTLPEPWLALTVAMPYLILVVAMGYTRQAVALGIVMAGLAALVRGGSFGRFVVYVAVATLFHKSAVITLPLALFAGERSRLLGLLGGVVVLFIVYDQVLSGEMETLISRYSGAELQSEGAFIRVAMNLIPAMLLLLFGRWLDLPAAHVKLWKNFSIVALLMIPLLYILPSTTAVDRFALYIVPLQLAILSRVPGTLLSPLVGRAIIILYSAAIMFVWLNFASNADLWLPYDHYLN